MGPYELKSWIPLNGIKSLCLRLNRGCKITIWCQFGNGESTKCWRKFFLWWFTEISSQRWFWNYSNWIDNYCHAFHYFCFAKKWKSSGSNFLRLFRALSVKKIFRSIPRIFDQFSVPQIFRGKQKMENGITRKMESFAHPC